MCLFVNYMGSFLYILTSSLPWILMNLFVRNKNLSFSEYLNGEAKFVIIDQNKCRHNLKIMKAIYCSDCERWRSKLSPEILFSNMKYRHPMQDDVNYERINNTFNVNILIFLCLMLRKSFTVVAKILPRHCSLNLYST